MEVHFCYDPLPVHIPFHATTAREKLLLGAVGAGKAMILSTMIQTQRGWITLGEIEVGDKVYDEQGNWCNVTAVYEHEPKNAYELTFDNGEKVRCGGEHLWDCWDEPARASFTRQGNKRLPDGKREHAHQPTYPDNWPQWRSKDRHGNELKNGPKTRNTDEIAEIHRAAKEKNGRTGASIPTTRPLAGHHQEDLPLDPYVLGYWLGDGCARSGQFAAHEDDQAHLMGCLRDCGFDPVNTLSKSQVVSTRGLYAKLRELGVLNDKHVPELYLTASIEDRLALLQGLMDSDGTADATACKVEFMQKRKHISEAVFELAASLGQKPTIKPKRATLNGKDYGEVWRVCWRPTQGIVPFRLPRKAERVLKKLNSGCYALRAQTHYITDVQPVPVEPMRCLTVDSPNNLFLITRSQIPTHNTLALVGDSIQFGLQQPGSRILVGRREGTKLKITTERELINLLAKVPDGSPEGATSLYDLCDIKKAHGHVDSLFLPNGSEIMFRGLEDYMGLQSINVAAIYIDEASEMHREAYDTLMSRLRQTEPTMEAQKMGYRWGDTPRHLMALASNPAGHNYIWDLFINPKTPQPSTGRVFFRSTMFDNPHLTEDFITSMMERPKAWRDRFVLCRDDAFSGQILTFGIETHVVEPFDPPDSWRRVMGLDWGLRSPTACVWWAQNPETGVWFQYREWQSYDPTDPRQKEEYQTMNVHDVARKIIELETKLDVNGNKRRENIFARAADPQIAERQASDGKSIQHWFTQYGLHFRGGLKHHDPRINALNAMLAKDLKLCGNCDQTIVAFQQYRWEEPKLTSGDRDAPERPRKKDDHLVDASQYIATLIVPRQKLKPETKPRTADDRIWEQVKRQVHNKHNTYSPRAII